LALRLHDVDDLEAFCTAAARKFLRRNNSTLREHDLEDLIGYLTAECWAAGLRFDSRPGIEFSGWAGRILGQRCVDWFRRFHGVDGRYDYGGKERARAIRFALSLDGPVELDDGDISLGEVIPAAPEHDPLGADPAYRRLLGSTEYQAAKELVRRRDRTCRIG
jgi:hypothetical protein